MAATKVWSVACIGSILLGEYYWDNIIGIISLGQYYWDNVVGRGSNGSNIHGMCPVCACAFAFDTRYEFKRKKMVETYLLSGRHDRMTICKNLWKLGLLIHNGQKIHRLLGDQVQGDLEISHFQISGQDLLRHLIIDEADLLPVDALLVVLLLLHLEDVRHEELLQVLVGVVDAELLEAVRVKVLKAEDVEDPNCAFRPLCLRLEDGHVHPKWRFFGL